GQPEALRARAAGDRPAAGVLPRELRQGLPDRRPLAEPAPRRAGQALDAVAESVGATSISRGGLGVEPFPSRPEAREWRREPATIVGLCLLAPAVLLLVALFVVPVVRIVWQDMAEPTFGLDRFREFWTSPAPRRALVTTLRISGLVTLLCTTLSVLIAWELHSTRSRLVKIALWSATLFPLWTSGVVR